jgi:hypothetical protein
MPDSEPTRTGGEPAAPPGPPRRRRGTLRRWVLRPAVWSLAGLAIVLLGVAVLFDSALLRERLRVFVAGELGALLGREVTLEAVDLDLLPLSLELRGLVVAASDPAAAPVLELGRLYVLGDLVRLRKPKLHLQQVVVERPRLRLEVAADGTTNLPIPQLGDGGGGELAVEVDLVRLVDGELVLAEASVPLDLEARGVEANLLATSDAETGPERLEGQVRIGQVAVALPGLAALPVAVSARVGLDPRGIAISHAEVRHDEMVIAADGRVSWAPATTVELDFSLDAELAVLERLDLLAPGEARGDLVVDGSLHYANDGFALHGDVAAREADFAGFVFRDLAAGLAVDEEGARLDLAAADFAAGTVGGVVEVDWSPEARRADGVVVRCDLRAEELELEAVLATLGVPPIGVAARLSGPVVYELGHLAPFAGVGRAELAVLPGALGDPAGRRLELGGQVVLEAAEGRLWIADLAAPAVLSETSGQTVRIAGEIELSPVRGELALALGSPDLGRVLPLVPGAVEPDGSWAPWAPAAGRGEVTARLRFDDRGTRAELALDLAEVRALGAEAEQVRGSLAIDESAVSGLDLVLTREGDQLAVRGEFPFSGPGFRVALAARPWRLERAGPWLPFPLPVDGRFRGEVELVEEAPAAGLPDSGGLAGRVTGRVTGARWRGLGESAQTPAAEGPADAQAATPAVDAETTAAPAAAGAERGPTPPAVPAAPAAAPAAAGPALGDLVLDLRLGPERVEVLQATLEMPAGSVAATGSVGLGDELALALAVRARQLDLAAPPLSAGTLAGRVDLTASVAGTFADPRLEVVLEGRELALDRVPIGSGEARLGGAWIHRSVALEGHLGHLVRLHGGGSLDDEEVALEAAVELPDLAGWLPLIGATGPAAPRLGGSASGQLRLAGRLDAPLVPELTLAQLAVATAEHQLVNLEPVRLALDTAGEGALEVRSLYLGVPGRSDELFVSGRVGLSPPYALALRSQASFDLDWLRPLLAEGVVLSGMVDWLATVGGTLAQPLPNGEAHVRSAHAVVAGLPSELEDLDAVVLLYPGEVVLDGLRARFAGGRLRAEGSLALAGGGFGNGSGRYGLQLAASDVAVRWPEGWVLRGDAQLALQETAPGERRVTGQVELTQAYYLRDLAIELTQLLPRLLQRGRLEVEEADEWLAATELDVLLRLGDALAVRNNVANLTGGGELTVSGTLARPVVFGRVELARGGRLRYADNDYTVERGLLTFANPHRIDPILDLVATTEVRDYQLRLDLRGTLDRLTANLASDPPLPDLDVLALVATGEAFGSRAEYVAPEPGTTTSGSGAELLLMNQATRVITSRVGQLFRLDEFRIDPNLSSGASSAGRVTVGKRISRDVYATYTYDPASAERQVLEVEWRVSPEWSVYLTQNGDGTYAVDLRWERAY